MLHADLFRRSRFLDRRSTVVPFVHFSYVKEKILQCSGEDTCKRTVVRATSHLPHVAVGRQGSCRSERYVERHLSGLRSVDSTYSNSTGNILNCQNGDAVAPIRFLSGVYYYRTDKGHKSVPEVPNITRGISLCG